MNQQYSSLFKLISQTMENTAEKAMEQNKEKGDLKAYATAKQMRDEYTKITDNFSTNENYIPDKATLAQLLIGANIVASNIDSRIKQEQKALAAYRTDLIPKLKKAMDEPEKIEEIFKVND